MRDAGDTEIGAFGISPENDLLFVEDIELVRQICTFSTVKFDDAAIADFFDAQVDLGRRPEQFARLWIHTHPGNSAEPSGTDEQTFARVFGQSQWAVMFILARGGQTYARLRYNIGPSADLKIPVDIDYGLPFAASNAAGWQEQYESKVQLPRIEPTRKGRFDASVANDDEFPDAWWRDAWDQYSEFDHNPLENNDGFVREF